ncbi:Glutathione S-transferase U22, partial [Linum grandiflorum]
ILDCWASPFCARVKLALAVKGLEFEARQEDLFVGKSELLLSSNRIYKKFPVFLHNGNPICESTIIVSYIDEVFDSASGVWKASGEEAVEGAKKEFVEVLKVLEGGLGEKDYFGREE